MRQHVGLCVVRQWAGRDGAVSGIRTGRTDGSGRIVCRARNRPAALRGHTGGHHTICSKSYAKLIGGSGPALQSRVQGQVVWKRPNQGRHGSDHRTCPDVDEESSSRYVFACVLSVRFCTNRVATPIRSRPTSGRISCGWNTPQARESASRRRSPSQIRRHRSIPSPRSSFSAAIRPPGWAYFTIDKIRYRELSPGGSPSLLMRRNVIMYLKFLENCSKFDLDQ